MKTRIVKLVLFAVVTIANLAVCAVSRAAVDPLPSWNDGAAKQAIVDFVRAATDKNNPKYVPPEERIATFDIDGTLWVEQPICTQFAFAVDRITAMAPKHPQWKEQEPFKTILAHDQEAMAKFTPQDAVKIIAATHSGMTVETFHNEVRDWLAAAKHPRFNRPYTELAYQPMLEVMRYLRTNGFKTYVVTGSGQEFIRAFAEKVFGVPPEQVIGSVGRVKYEYDKDGNPTLVKLPDVLLVDDKTGKPESINMFIGRRPVAAFGNSTGDQQMLEWAQAGKGARLMMLVRHDDADREYAYGANSSNGTFSDALIAEAANKGWTVVSMKNDWKRVFPFE
jgi:hypothetical protein